MSYGVPCWHRVTHLTNQLTLRQYSMYSTVDPLSQCLYYSICSNTLHVNVSKTYYMSVVTPCEEYFVIRTD